MKNILELNEDCLQEILSYLDMYELMALIEASPQFENSACTAFGKKYKNEFIDVNIASTDSKILRIFGSVISKLYIHSGYANEFHTDYEKCNEIIQYCGRTVVEIKFHYFGDAVMRILCQPFENLQKVCFSSCRLDETVTQFAWCPKLFHLEFISLKNKSVNIQRSYPHLHHFTACLTDAFTNSNLREFLYFNTQLTGLTLYRCKNVTGDIIEVISDMLPRIESLYLDIYEDQKRDYQPKSLNMKCLKRLTLKYYSLTSDIITTLAMTNHQLEELELSDCNASNELINSICDLKKLKRIKIEYERITDGQLIKLAKMLPKLAEVYIVYRLNPVLITTDGILEFVRNCQFLRKLRLSTYSFKHKFNLSFHEQFLSIVQNRHCAVKLVIQSYERKIEITKNMIVENGCVLCWNNPQNRKSATTLLNMDDKCLTEIFAFLDDEDHVALSEIRPRFKLISRNVLASKYGTEYFAVRIEGDEEDNRLDHYRSLFSNFGDLIATIRVYNSKSSWIDDELCDMIIQYSSQTVTKMDIIDVGNNMLTRLCQPFPSLKKLRFQIGRLSVPASFFTWFPNLTHIKFHSVHVDNPECIARAFPHLEYFTIEMNRSFRNEDINEFIDNNPQLKCLILSCCEHLSTNIIEFMDNKLVHLERLYLDCYGSIETTLSLRSLNFCRLKKLILFRSKLTASILAAMAIGSNQLEELVLRWDTPMDDDLINEICKFRELKLLSADISSITDKNMFQLARNLTKLNVLSIGWNKHDTSVDAIIAFAEHCRDLKTLHLDFHSNESPDIDKDIYPLYKHFVQDLNVAVEVSTHIGTSLRFVVTEELIKERHIKDFYDDYPIVGWFMD